jgi:hypothetical protein
MPAKLPKKQHNGCSKFHQPLEPNWSEFLRPKSSAYPIQIGAKIIFLYLQIGFFSRYGGGREFQLNSKPMPVVTATPPAAATVHQESRNKESQNGILCQTLTNLQRSCI